MVAGGSSFLWIGPLHWWHVVAVGTSAVIVTLGVISWSLAPVDSTNTTPVLLRIETGATVATVSSELGSRHLIRSALAFKTLARLHTLTLKTGLYSVSPADSPATILDRLELGNVSEQQLTIPEGWRREEIAEALLRANLIQSTADFLDQTVVTDATLPDLVARFQLTPDDSLEGFLFPDTYRFAKDLDAAAIVRKLLETFERRTQGLDLTYADVILASMVEREAKFSNDRAPIAGVFAHRLSLGMALQSNPTVEVARANADCAAQHPASCHLSDWWPTPRSADFKSLESPYNTYRVTGLPLTPIANPGLASLQAALQPDTSGQFLYFVTDSDGHAHFAKTLDEHNRNASQFLGTNPVDSTGVIR